MTFSGYPVYVLFVSYSYSTLYSYFDYVTKYRTGGFIFSSNQAALDYYIFLKENEQVIQSQTTHFIFFNN